MPTAGLIFWCLVLGIQATLVGAAILLAVPSVLIMLLPGVRGVRRTPDGLIVAPTPGI